MTHPATANPASSGGLPPATLPCRRPWRVIRALREELALAKSNGRDLQSQLDAERRKNAELRSQVHG